MVEVKCRSCGHWEAGEGGALGLCLQKPSKIESNPSDGNCRIYYRSTYPDEYCEEWQREKRKPADDN